MYPYFVRVYTMLDGTKREIAARYKTYERAEAELDLFGTKGCLFCGKGASGMSPVMYASIEKRFAPQPLDDAPTVLFNGQSSVGRTDGMNDPYIKSAER